MEIPPKIQKKQTIEVSEPVSVFKIEPQRQNVPVEKEDDQQLQQIEAEKIELQSQLFQIQNQLTFSKEQVNLSNKRLNDSFKKSIELESKVRSLQKDLFNNASKLKQAESHIEFERLKLASVESQLNDQTSLTDFFKDQLTIKQAQIDQFIKMQVQPVQQESPLVDPDMILRLQNEKLSLENSILLQRSASLQSIKSHFEDLVTDRLSTVLASLQQVCDSSTHISHSSLAVITQFSEHITHLQQELSTARSDMNDALSSLALKAAQHRRTEKEFYLRIINEFGPQSSKYSDDLRERALT